MADKDVLIVVSKLKNYIKESAGMNTAGTVAEKLTEIVKEHCKQAVDNARSDGRKTVMDRDFTSSGSSNNYSSSAHAVNQ